MARGRAPARVLSPPVLGIRPNLGRFSMLVLVNAFVGAMVRDARRRILMSMDALLTLEVPTASRAFTRDELQQAASVRAREAAGRFDPGVPAVEFGRLAAQVDVPEGVTHVTFHAIDGYAASIPLEQALADAILLVPSAEEGRSGVRLVVNEGSTACLNVKAVDRVELTVGPGKHTVDPKPHRNPPVEGWDQS